MKFFQEVILTRAAEIAEALYSMPRNHGQLALPASRSSAMNNASGFSTYAGQLSQVESTSGQWDEPSWTHRYAPFFWPPSLSNCKPHCIVSPPTDDRSGQRNWPEVIRTKWPACWCVQTDTTRLWRLPCEASVPPLANLLTYLIKWFFSVRRWVQTDGVYDAENIEECFYGEIDKWFYGEMIMREIRPTRRL